VRLTRFGDPQRSWSDGKVFDLIPAVADRYQHRRDCMTLEVWKPNRRIRTIRPGVTPRVQAPAPFRLRWSQDEWKTTQDTTATATALNIHYMDIPVQKDQSGSIRFIFFWTDEDRWEDKEYQIDVQKNE
jgi:glucoamylase